MKLKSLTIRNFRSITELQLTPRQLTTLIGKNSSGKSNILRALRFFFTASAKSAIAEDISTFSDEDGTWVECVFEELTASEVDELTKYLRHDGTIRVRRSLHLDGDRCSTKLRGYIESPTEPWLQVDYADYADMAGWEAIGVDVAAYAPIGKQGKLTKAGFGDFRKEYIRRHGQELRFEDGLSDTEFKGRQSTAAALLPHFIFVPAVGDIVSVIYGKQSSLLNEIVAAAINAGKSHQYYEAAQSSLLAAQDLVNPSEHRLGTLSNIEKDLEKRLSTWPGTKVTIRTRIDDLARLLVNGLNLAVDDGNDTDLADKGDGIQRQILFQVFRLYADFRAGRGIFAPAEGEPAFDRGPNIIAFEEPELFLHPQAQESFYDDLLTVASRDQVVLATHSSYLIRLEQADGVHIVKRDGRSSPTRVTRPDRGWLKYGARRENQVKRLKEISLCSGDMSKVFFADRVIITEGQEDIIYIVGTAKEHATCLDRRVTVVEAGGKTGVPTLQRVLNAFAIPYVVACDQDPGDPSTERNLKLVRALVDDANNAIPGIARLEVFNPDLPTECHGRDPLPPKKKFSVADAYQLIRDGKPAAQFATRVSDMFRLT